MSTSQDSADRTTFLCYYNLQRYYAPSVLLYIVFVETVIPTMLTLLWILNIQGCLYKRYDTFLPWEAF